MEILTHLIEIKVTGLPYLRQIVIILQLLLDQLLLRS
jgi:hypothetical protein